MNFPNISPETINAIAGLWKLVAVVTVLIAVILFQAPIKTWLLRLSRLSVKRGDMEVMVEGKEATEKEIVKPIAGDTVEHQKTVEEKPANLPTPQDTSGWFSSMFDAFMDRDFERAQNAFESLQSSEIDATERTRNQVIYHYLLYRHANDMSAIQAIQKIAETKEIRAFALAWLANCYQYSRAYQNAIDTLRYAIQASLTPEERAQHTSSLAQVIQEAGDVNEAIAIIKA